MNFSVAEDLSITRIAGLSWDQWSARLVMPLVTQLREGAHPLVLPRDLSIKPETNSKNSPPSPNSCGGSPSGIMGNNAGFSCNECGRLYKLKSSLRNHQKWECGKEPQFQCPYCVYRAKQKMHIGRHMERMHKERFFKMEGDKVIPMDDELMAYKLNHGQMIDDLKLSHEQILENMKVCQSQNYDDMKMSHSELHINDSSSQMNESSNMNDSIPQDEIKSTHMSSHVQDDIKSQMAHVV